MKYFALLDYYDSLYTLFVPDFPGLVAYGKTLEQVKEQGCICLKDRIEMMMDCEYKLPSPSPLSDLMKIAEYRDFIPFEASIVNESTYKVHIEGID